MTYIVRIVQERIGNIKWQTMRSNTVRVIEDDEIIKHVEDFHKINIRNTYANENFTRVLEDVSTAMIKGTRIFIFSWRK